MGEFLTTVFSLPTAFYTVLLGVVIGYWLLSALGLVGGEMIDGWIGGDGHGHGGHGLGDHTLADGAYHHQQGLFDSYVCAVSVVNFLAASLAQLQRTPTHARLQRIERLHVALDDLEPQM